MTLRVVVADDQVLVRTGFRMIIDARDDLEVVGEASDGHEAVRLTRDLAPDVVLMDVRMPVLDGIEATRQIAECGSRARVLVLTTWDVDAHVVAALRAGASGFLLKDIRPAELADAIRLTARGDALLAPAVMSRVLDRFLRSTADPAPPPSLRDLSGRERGTHPDRAGTVERGDRRAAAPVAGHRQEPRHRGAAQTGPARPRPGCRRRLRPRPRTAAPTLTARLLLKEETGPGSSRVPSAGPFPWPIRRRGDRP